MLGYSVIPTNGKVATIPWSSYQTHKPSLEQLRQWFIEDGYTGLAIITGSVSGLVVLDFDDLTPYRRFIEKYQHLAQTHTVKTKRGFHLYYHLPPYLTTRSRSVPGIDLQSEGKYVVAPPTCIEGHPYTVLQDDESKEINPKTLTADDIATITEFLDQQRRSTRTETLSNNHSSATAPQKQNRTGKRHSKRPDAQSKGIHPADLAALYRFASAEGEGGRNNTLFKLACLGRDNGLTQEQVTQALADSHADQQANSEHRTETLWQRHREAIRTIQSAFSRPARESLHRYKEPEQLSNPIREALFAEKLTCVVRVIEGLRLKGIQPNQAITRKLAVNLLDGIVGRDSVYRAFNTVLENGQPVFETTQNPLPRTPSPNTYGVAISTVSRQNSKCIEFKLSKSGKTPKGGRPTTYFIMPSNIELAEKLAIRHSTISDELTLDDLKSAKTTRNASHARFIERKPGQHTIHFFAKRLGLSERTIYRYNAEDENIHSKPLYTNQAVFWHNLEAIIPADPDYFPHDGVFLMGTGGKKYPPKREIARKLLAEGQQVVLKTREANYWYYGEQDQPMPFRLQADYHAIIEQMEERERRRQRRYFPRPHYLTIPPERVAAPERVVAPKRVVATAAPTTQQTQPQRSVTRETIASTLKPKPAAFGRKPEYRQPLENPQAEAFAQTVHRKLSHLSEGKEGRSSLPAARRMVAEYGETAVRRALKTTATRRNIRKPIGFISTLLRSEKVERRMAL
jgi:hypothetical protein